MIDFDKLTITDDVMFTSVFRDKELCRHLLEMLLGIQVESIEYVEPEERLRPDPTSRAGVLDLLVHDAEGNSFDVEMQNRANPDIALRARRYLSLIDVTALDRGQDFNEARGIVVIFLCSNDPFDRGWKCYDYPRICTQDGKVLNDRTELVFVNAQGTRGDFGPELDAFLRYVRDGAIIESDYVRKVDDRVRSLRDSPEWRRHMMLWSEKYRDEFNKARREGLAAGREEGREEGRVEGRAEGRVEGRAQERTTIASLYAKLQAAGRGDELAPALTDQSTFDRLAHEFGIEQ